MELIIGLILLLGLGAYYLYNTVRTQQFKKAETAVDRGDLDTALSIFMESLKRDPTNVDAIWHLGNINEEKGLYPEAIGYYNQLLQIGKESKLFTPLQLYKRIAILYKKMNMDKEALDYFMQAYEMAPSSRDIIDKIAMIIYTQKQYIKSLPYFEKAYMLVKGDSELLKHYGLCLAMLEKYSEAASVLLEAKTVNPMDYEIRFILGYVYLKMGSYSQASQFIESVINDAGSTLNIQQSIYAVKILYLCYLQLKNFEITKDLVGKLQELVIGMGNNPEIENAVLAYILFRVKQGYYDTAISEIEKSTSIFDSIDKLTASTDSDAMMSVGGQNEKSLHKIILELNQLKKDKEKMMVSAGAHTGPKYEFDMSLIEKKTKDNQDAVDKIFDNWKKNYVDKQTLWDFFGAKAKSSFDPSLVIDKYKTESLKVLKTSEQTKLDRFESETEIEYEDFSAMMKNVDFPKFMVKSRDLAEAMGFRVINQVVKIDKIAYAEKKGVDMLCTEKYNQNNRVLFCVRRFDDPIGNIAITDLISSMRVYQATRIILVSTSPLSQEARLAIEGRSVVDFYLCDEVAHYLS